MLEALVVVVGIAAIAIVALPVASNLSRSASESKLQSDVASVNQAIQVYRANGGSLDGISAPNAVLSKLKTANANSTTYAGLRGSVIDKRLQAVLQTEQEAASGLPRAIWNASEDRFDIASTGSGGVARFQINEDLATVDFGSEVREEETFDYNGGDGWVWAFDENGTPVPRQVPTLVAVAGTLGNDGGTGSGSPGGLAGGSGGDDDDSENPGATKLLPPEFSLPTGNYPLVDFDLELTLSNPNDPQESYIFYRRGRDSQFVPYYGQAIEVSLNERVYAYVKSLNLASYTDSDVKGEHFDGAPVDLELELASSQTSFTYFELTDADPYAIASVANLDEVPEEMRSGIEIGWVYDERSPLDGETGTELAGQPIPVQAGSWNGQPSATLTAAVSGTGNYIRESGEETLNFTASQLALESPSIGVTQAAPGSFDVTMELTGRYPAGTAIYYTLDGSNPGRDPNTGEVDGILYEGTFSLTLDSETTVTESDEDQPEEGSGGPVEIQQVVMQVGGNEVVQDEDVRGKHVNDSSTAGVELKSLTIAQDGETLEVNHLNVLEVAITDINYPDNSQDVSVWSGGQQQAAAGDEEFRDELGQALSSPDLRYYLNYGKPKRKNPENFFHFDMSFAPIYNTDFLVVGERNGNSTFALTPLDGDGQVIPGSSTVEFDSYQWNTGYAPNDYGNQPFFLDVVDVQEFGVDTRTTPIRGFRVTNTDGADIKFYTISDTPFEGRTEELTRYDSTLVTAAAFPPAGLDIWFEPSAPASYEVRDQSEEVTVHFTQLSSSAGYLNEASIFINDEAYDFGNSDMGAGYSFSVDILVNPFVTNRFDLAIDTWVRWGSNMASDPVRGLDTRNGGDFDLIDDDDSFYGPSQNTGKIKDLSYDSQVHLIVGYEDLLAVGHNPDWDYDDFLFEIRADQPFNFSLGGFVSGSFSQNTGSQGSGSNNSGSGNSGSTVGNGSSGGSNNGHGNGGGSQSNNGHGNNIDGVDSSNPGQGVGGPTGANNSGNDPSQGFDDERGSNGGGNSGNGNGN